MRELKFRAWDKNLKTMVQVIAVHSDRWQVSHDNVTDFYFLDKSNSEIMQFTGLKDKNGKEIYEGDIVADSREKEKKEKTKIIAWFRGGFMLQKIGWFGYHDIESYDRDSEKHLEVIGNLYENKGLLK